MAKAKRRDEFVVGYVGAKQCVYGRNDSEGRGRWTDPLTARQALHGIRKLVSYEDDAGTRLSPTTIYRLVPVSVAEVERQAARKRKARARARGKRKGDKR